jgi:hypothetical protein
MVLRLALIYALLECPLTSKLKQLQLSKLRIKVEHLNAALAVWDYCEASVYYLYADKSGDPLGDKILELLRAEPLSRNDFNRHLSADQKKHLPAILEMLRASGRVRMRQEKQSGPGRPLEMWERV